MSPLISMRFEAGSIARALALLVLMAMLSPMIGCPIGGPNPDAWLEIRGQRIAIEIADTPEKKAKGLGDRDSLAWDRGMYFKYSEPAFYAFWMKGMRFSIDIIWLRDGRIIGYEPNVPFEAGSNGPTVRPRELIDAVLEVPAGYFLASGWQIGDPVRLEDVRAN